MKIGDLNDTNGLGELIGGDAIGFRCEDGKCCKDENGGARCDGQDNFYHYYIIPYTFFGR